MPSQPPSRPSHALQQSQLPQPPVASKHPHTLTAHGEERQDPYYWLRAENWQAVMQDPSGLAQPIRSYLEAENAYAQAAMASMQPLIQSLHQEMIGRIKEDETSPPNPYGPYAYFTRFVTGGQHPQYWRQVKDQPETAQLIFDADVEAKKHAFYNIGAAGPSPDHRLWVIAEDTHGNEAYSLRFFDLETATWLDDQVPNTGGDVSWLGHSDGVLYTTLDNSHRSSKLWRHMLGQSAQDNTLVYEETDGAWQIGIGKTCSGRFHLLDRHTSGSNEIYILDAFDPVAVPRSVAAPQPEVQYSLEDHQDRWFILTNADGATDFKICTAPLADPKRENWQTWLAERPGVLLESLDVFQGYLVREESEQALPRIVVHDFATGAEHSIDQPEQAYALQHYGSRDYDSSLTRYAYNSPTTPTQVFDYDMASREKTLVFEQVIPSGHDASAYVTERLMLPSHDGVKVPTVILRRADTPVDGSAALFVYGYGAYGLSQAASFSALRLSLVDRGVIFALAQIRGGMDMGYNWYRDGKLDKKPNSFLDFISVTQGLLARGYGQPGRVAAMGGSAGGLLMGAVMNMRSDLYRAVVASVPFVDVLTTILDPDLPLTPGEWTEWGNPIEDRGAYDLIKSYSPYDNVQGQGYPALFVTAGIADPRVTYWEPAKWVAKLRQHKTDDHVLIFKTNMTAGHFGISGRFDRLKEVAEEYAFVLTQLGVCP